MDKGGLFAEAGKLGVRGNLRLVCGSTEEAAVPEGNPVYPWGNVVRASGCGLGGTTDPQPDLKSSSAVGVRSGSSIDSNFPPFAPIAAELAAACLPWNE